MYVFFRPCNQENAIIFLIMLVGMVGVFSILRGINNVDKINEFLAENRITFLVGVLLLVLVCWLHKDTRRNEPVYEDTNATVGRIEERMSAIEQRVDSMSNRLEKAEKTVSGTIVTIRDSRENAVTVADGITGTESRLNDAVQRSGRIQNLISDIETANNKGKKNP